MTKHRAGWILTLLIMVAELMTPCAPRAMALDGGTLRVNPRNGWKAFEVISINDDPSGDGFTWSMPGTFDGLGAWLPDASTLRVQVNHEVSDATISEVNLDLASFQTAIANTISSGTPGVTFVNSARQAYDRWSSNGGQTWINTSSPSTTNFNRFCSGQSYLPNTFGAGRGFVDNVYITGEESFGNVNFDRLFALDLDNRDFYQLSDVAGSASGGIGGMPKDSWENAALLDTGETDHVALLLSPDGGTSAMKLYIGEKGLDPNGNASNDFLARNGLAYGSYYFLNDALPTTLGGTSTNGTFDTTIAGALVSSKLEDVDTSPSDPTRAVLGDQTSGLFTFDFSFDFGGGSFSAAGSSFSITKTQNDVSGTLGTFGDPDNVDWTAPTAMNGTNYPDGLIFVNEDNSNGEIWMNAPDGSDLTLIGDTAGITGSTESSGILDISNLLGFNPGSILLTSNQGGNDSLTVLIHPQNADFDGDDDRDGVDFLTWQRNFGIGTLQTQGDAENDGDVDRFDLDVWESQYGSPPPLSTATAVPEPSAMVLALSAGLALFARRRSAKPTG